MAQRGVQVTKPFLAATAGASGPAPPQSGAGRTAGSAGTEWLTVNVWSLDLDAARLPVLVWIYGGAYVFGSSRDPLYDAAMIAHLGLVVVTFNYRMGAEGFAQLGGAPANRGLLAALHPLEPSRRIWHGHHFDPCDLI